LAMYIGWVRAGRIGASLVGLAFVVPSFVMVLALAAIYLQYGGLSWMQGAFYGIRAAVIAIIARSAFKLVRLTLKPHRLLWVVFVGSALITAWTESEIIWVFLASGVLVLLVRCWPWFTARAMSILPPSEVVWLISGLHGPATGQSLWTILWYFTEAGAFV